jgi:hypothetical protein
MHKKLSFALLLGCAFWLTACKSQNEQKAVTETKPPVESGAPKIYTTDEV